MVINTKENVKKNLFKERHVMKTINKFNTSAVSPHIESWSLIDWKEIYEYVKKLRQRIFRAEQLGQKRKVRKLQRLMIKSNANLLLSIKRVTQINKGKKTAGVDGQIAISSSDRLRLYNLLKKYSIKYIRPKPAKRVYIVRQESLASTYRV